MGVKVSASHFHATQVVKVDFLISMGICRFQIENILLFHFRLTVP